MGIFAGIGTLLAFAITYALAPSFLRKSSEELPVNTFDFTPFVKWVDRQKRGIVIGFALIVGLGIWGVSKVKIDAYLLNDFPENSEVRASFRLADEIIGGTKPWQISIWVKDSTQSVWDVDVQREVDKVTDYLENDYPVASILSTSLILQYANYVEKGSFEIPEKNRRKTLILAQQIANQTKIKLVSNDKRKVRITGNIPEFGSYNTGQRNQKLFRYLEENIDHNLIEYQLTGTNYLIDQSHEMLAEDMVKSLLIAIVLVSIMLGIYFRSFRTVLVALVPNLIPLILIGGLIYVFNVPIQISTSVIFALVFGIVVDDTIHFLATYRGFKNLTKEERLIQTFNSAGKGMVNTTLVLLSGFAIFMLSSFGATFYLGFFLCISLLLALLTDFLLLPVLIRKFSK